MSDSQDKNKKEHKDHVYDDDIIEQDNPAPFWWQFLFYVCIVFGLGYIYYYIGMGGPTLKQELAVKLQAIEEQRAKDAPKGPSESELLVVFNDPAQVKAGHEVFTSKCASCHAPDGGGLIGPNLTDHFWINGNGSLSAIFKVVNEGVADKGMPPWGPVLPAKEVQQAVAFVRSLKGTHPATPKAPQGTEVKEAK